MEVKDRNPQLINKLLEVWENSVRATHHFLSNEQILEIKKYIPEALGSIPYLIVETDKNENSIAFMGIENHKLEILFIVSKYRGKGIGKALLLYGIKKYEITNLAVNEDKPQAKEFYEHMEFKVYQRNELDGQGAPYPVLYMKLDR